jgi:putative acetyltransferase
MIRKMNGADIPVVMEIWLETNIKAHDFISSEYWKKNYAAVGQMMQDAEIYVCEKHGEIEGFVGLADNYVAGIFVKEKYQSEGIGKALLDYVKEGKEELVLHVYEKNERAIKFYLWEGFVKVKEQIEEENQEWEYEMRWRHDGC